MTVTKVLIDGGARLNIIFFRNTKEDGARLCQVDHPNRNTLLWKVPGKAAMPLMQITLPDTFGTQANYRTKFIQFEVADFETSYHAIHGRPALVKFMAIPHYPYLLLKMPGPHRIISLRGNLKRAFDCDIQAIQIVVKTQVADGREEITTVTTQINPEELEIPAKKPCILAPQKKS
jgi:hypothetical protein